MKVSSLNMIMKMEEFTENQVKLIRKLMKEMVKNGGLTFNEYRLVNTHISDRRIEK